MDSESTRWTERSTWGSLTMIGVQQMRQFLDSFRVLGFVPGLGSSPSRHCFGLEIGRDNPNYASRFGG